MLTIRLTRKGKKNQPFFRVVLVDKRKSSKGGRSLEDLGYKNPLTKKVSLKKERILYWISKGAQPSESIHNLLISEKIIEGKKIHVSKLSTKKKAEIVKAKEEVTAKAAAAASQNEASLAPEGAGSPPVEPAPAEEAKPE
jgi:small subunit ribosomal protein S16